MKTNKFLLHLAMTLLPLAASAQTDSVSALRFVYEFEKPSSKFLGYKDRENLDVLPDGSSRFYSTYDTRYRIMTTSHDAEAIDPMDFKSKKMGEPYQVYRNATDNELTFVTTIPDDFYYTEKNPTQEWSIDDKDTMTVCGYVCKKATTTYGGRHWTAWFAEDLPIDGGPWKLFGLPGLILAAHDADNIYHFNCIGMEQVTIAPWLVDTKKYAKCTNKEYQKQLRLFDSDPTAYTLRQLGISPESVVKRTVVDQNGNPVDEDRQRAKKDNRTYLEKLPEDKQ